MTKEANFLVYLIENYKDEKGLSGKEITKLFKKYDVYNYVLNSFGALHCEGPRANEWDIDKYLSNRGAIPPKRVLTHEVSYI